MKSSSLTFSKWKFSTAILILALITVSFVSLYQLQAQPYVSATPSFIDVTIEGKDKLGVNETSQYTAVINSQVSSQLSISWTVTPEDNKILLQVDGDRCSLTFLEATQEPYLLSVSVKDLVRGNLGSASKTVYDPYTSPALYLGAFGAPYSYMIESDGLGWYRAINGANGSITWSSTDATTVIQNAINNGENVYISAGSYIGLSPIILKRNINIVGAGIGITSLRFTGDGFKAIGNSSYAFWGIHISGLGITGANVSEGIDLAYAFSDTRIENVRVEYFDANMKLTDCYTASIIDSDFNYGVNYGVLAYNSHGATVENVKMYGNLNGLGIYNCAGMHVSHNTFEANSGTGLIINWNTPYRPEKVSVIANYFEGNGKDITDKGIASSIESNRFYNSHSALRSITVENASSTINNNFFQNYTTSAVWVVSGALNTLIDGNVLANTPALLVNDGTGTRYHNNRNETSWLTNSSP